MERAVRMGTGCGARRVVVTGLGIVSPIGNTVAAFWQNLLAGVCGIRPINDWDATGFPSRLAGQVDGFDPTLYMDKQAARRADRFAQFAVASAFDAVRAAKLDFQRLDRERVAAVIGTAIGGFGIVEREAVLLREGGPRRVSPTLIPAVIGNMAGCLTAILLGIHGPVLCPVGACATGCMAIGDAMRLVADGTVDVALAGGSESVTTPLAVASFGRLGALSRRDDDPARACLPFDVERDGTVLSEGAAVLVLESEEHAQARGADILCELAGYGVTADAYHIAAPDPNGTGAARAMQAALRNAGATPEDVTFVCAHGTGTPLNDISESKAIAQVLGEKVPVMSNKYSIGHTLGAAGAISSVMAVCALQEGVIPGTLNLRNKDPECPVNAIRANVCAPVHGVLVNAFGFGGQNASLFFRRYGDGQA